LLSIQTFITPSLSNNIYPPYIRHIRHTCSI
jgi:hypothetical protein